jgi:hypothetical protein
MTTEQIEKQNKEIQSKIENLTAKEKTYFSIMRGRNGVLYITSKPGIAKSAISRSIAKKMGFNYMDIRLSMVDETDVGLYPNISEIETGGRKMKCLDFVVPRWAVEANSAPTIIHFEELNRASLQVRNAALQILLERQIGIEFKFNENVLMMASGNLGDEDGTDVEEFDNALNNRLIHMKHTLLAEDWIEGFAKEHVHPMIVSYIKSYPERMYQDPNDNHKAYATPRSWTFLSDFIKENFGKNASPREFLGPLQEVAAAYVGPGAHKFLQYCQEMINISIQDILNRYDEIEKELGKYNRDKNSELIASLKELSLKKLNQKQIDNAVKFLKRVGEDELTGYLLHILDNESDVSDPKVKGFMLNFKDVLLTIKKINKPGSSK